jgi:hypothetical protein
MFLFEIMPKFWTDAIVIAIVSYSFTVSMGLIFANNPVFVIIKPINLMNSRSRKGWKGNHAIQFSGGINNNNNRGREQGTGFPSL